MKKYIGILLFSLMLFGCSKENVLEKLPPYEADLEGAITNAKTAELALLGVYSNLPTSDYRTHYTTGAFSFKAGTMRRPSWWTRGNAVYYYERYWPTLSGTRDYDWNFNYTLIKNANFLLTAIDKISDFEGNRGDEIIGELHFLRAVAYERLMLRYAQHWDMNSPLGLIIRNEIAGIDNVKKDRSSVADSYQMILDDLEVAIEKCADYSSCGQASKVAAKAYKTRVLFQMGSYSDCINMANKVLTHSDNALAPGYSTVFTDFESTNEILFGRMFGSNDLSGLEARQNAFSTGLWGPSPNYIALLGDDPRFDAIIGPEIDVEYRYGKAGNEYRNHTVKKLVNSANDLPIIYMRTAEIYLLKAEAIYRNGGSYEDAYTPIAELRLRAGAGEVAHSTQEEIERAICNEWLIEMSFENGHEYFVLRRFGVEMLCERNDLLQASLNKAINAGSESEAQYRLRIENFRILPLPSDETNGNPVVQNPGY